MEKINKKIKNFFINIIISSISFFIGIPIIIVGALKLLPLIAIGILFTVYGFYGTPIWFAYYVELKRTRRVVEAVEKENLYSVKEISLQLQMKEAEVREQITKIINKNYISGYLFNGENLVVNDKKKAKAKKIKCLNCGGGIVEEGGVVYCPYCNTKY